MPTLGLGTFLGAGGSDVDRQRVYQAVRDAISFGYRHIDTAHIYGIENEVGRAVNDAIAAGEVTRAELFIVTKLWLRMFKRDQVVPALKASLSKLNLDYIDLYLIHWPMPIVADSPQDAPVMDNETDVFTETWPGMEECFTLGLAKNIGVSNFNSEQIDKLMASAKVKPVANQVECHPFLAQRKLIDHCKKHNIPLTAYSPLGGTPIDEDKSNMSKDVRLGLFENALVKELTTKYHKTAGQILIKFQLQRGVIVIPKSITKSRIIENAEVFDFEMDQADVDKLEALNQNARYIHHKDMASHRGYPFHIEF